MPRPDASSFAEELRLPGPERTRIVEEIAGDLEEMREELIRRGMGPAEASEEALRLLAPSETALAALASVHEPLYASLTRRFSSGMRLAEWIGLVGVTLAAVGLSLLALVDAGVLRSPSPVMAPLLVVTVSVLLMAGRKAIQLHVVRDHGPERLYDGMSALLVASGSAIVLGFGGAVYELLRLSARLEAAPERTRELVPTWFLDTSVLICVGLATALVGGLAWFLLQQKISSVERADMRAATAMSRATTTTPLPFEPSIPSTGAPR
jgi:hypothetical protein